MPANQTYTLCRASFREYAVTACPYDVAELVNMMRSVNKFRFAFTPSVGPDGRVYGAGHHYMDEGLPIGKRLRIQLPACI